LKGLINKFLESRVKPNNQVVFGRFSPVTALISH
jgi:hypothetical protein